MEWLLWVDIETTGLDYQNDSILQIACILTDFKLNTKHIFQEFTLNSDTTKMNDWCFKQHRKSGLVDRVAQSTMTLQEAEKSIIHQINTHLSVRDTLYIAGNSVHFDKKFIDIHMPMLASRLSHRVVDVTSIGLSCKHLNREVYMRSPFKFHEHTAMGDILESIEEYKYYSEEFFNTKDV